MAVNEVKAANEVQYDASTNSYTIAGRNFDTEEKAYSFRASNRSIYTGNVKIDDRLDKEELAKFTLYDVNSNTVKDDGIYYDGAVPKGKFVNGKKEVEYENESLYDIDSRKKDEEDEHSLVFFPIYKVTDYTKDLNNWRKQINPFGIKGFFYFKIFFNFDTGYGLLGDENGINTAEKYLRNIQGLAHYKSDKLLDRLDALKRFKSSLNDISNNTPWFFREIGNLNNLANIYVSEDDFGMEKFVNIRCLEESTDTRLGTLFDLYKFACFNSIKNKEIIPSNLRKFEMSVLFMHVPLKRYQLGFTSLSNSTYYKDKELNFTSSDDYNNIMSVKMLTFQNCEFDPKSLNELNDNLSNENIFDLGGNVIRINYDRVYEHRINEYQEIAFGQDGKIFDYTKTRTNNVIPRLEAIANDIKLLFDSHTSSDEKDIYENLYGNFTNTHSQYYTKKLDVSKRGSIDSGNLYHYDLGRVGNGEFRKNTEYLNTKLRSLKNGEPMDYNLKLGHSNEFKLSWDADALNYNRNAINVEGNPSTSDTWIGKLADSTWQRIKSGFGF